MIFVPANVCAVSLADDSRLGWFFQSLRIGLLPTLLSALSVVLWAVVAPGSISELVLVALTAGVVLSRIVSPLQDHGL